MIEFLTKKTLRKVQITNSFADIKVRKVDAFADECGKWEIVDNFADFKVQFIDAFPGI